MLFPYRVKNPVKRFPFATLSLIALNVLVYSLTTDYFLVIREEVVKNYGFAWGTAPFLNFVTATFLHGDIFHLVGNMLYLWVFGPSVEGRLRIPLFLVAYFAAGLAGDMLQGAVDLAASGTPAVGIGASGCIMGILGAYWYLFSWSPVCVFYWIWWFWYGVWEIAAFWIIGLFILMDVAFGFLYGAAGVVGGVAHFAHVGGAVAGALICVTIGARRDTEAMSEAKAIQADMGDLSMVPIHALRTMLEQDPRNPDLLRALFQPAVALGRESVIHEAMKRAGPELSRTAPDVVARYLTDLNGDPSLYNSVHLLHAANEMQRVGDPARALKLYGLLVKTFPNSLDVEMTLYRMAQCHWNAYHDAQSARRCLDELAERFPYGPMTSYAQTLLSQMGQQAG